MCSYTTATTVYRQCQRTNNQGQRERHKAETRFYRRCENAANRDRYCENATFDARLGQFGETRRGGACPLCRDSGVDFGPIRYIHVSLLDLTLALRSTSSSTEYG